jgi:hypothetical protein
MRKMSNDNGKYRDRIRWKHIDNDGGQHKDEVETDDDHARAERCW